MSPRGGRGLAAVVVTLVAGAAGLGAAAPGCGGPLDSRPPRMTPDAGTDVRRTVDAARDPGARPDAMVIVDTGVSVPWPILPGCVSGFPPSPRFTPSAIPRVAISCAGSSPVLLQVSDAANQGMVFTTTLDPPISGIYSTLNGTVCANNGTSYPASVQLFVSQGASVPGRTFNTTLRITPVGPAQPGYSFPLAINTVPADFAVDPAVVDFGKVSQGAFMQMPLTVTNAAGGAPFDTLYATEPEQSIFSLLANGFGGNLQPGDSRPLLQAFMNALTPGTAEATFLVSPFAPGIPIDPSCGVIRTVTMRAQVAPTGPPIPGP